ncbi:MAG: insulinase family protein, partial [Pseudomonadota bacterium]
MRIPFLMSAAAFALTLAACAPATETDTSTGSDGASADPVLEVQVHDGEFATIQQFTTPGGVSVWLVEEPSIPILSLRMAWQAGATNDPEGIEGLTNAMVYHMNEGAGEMD